MVHEAEHSEQGQASIVRRVLVGTAWLTGWRAVSRLLGFVSLLALTQLLAPGDFGLVAMASAVAASIDGLSQLGVKDALVRLPEVNRDHFDTAFTFQMLRGVLTGGLIAAFSFQAEAWLGDARLQPILLALAALAVVSGCENIGIVRLSRNLDFRMQVILQAAPRLLGVILTIGIAWTMRTYWALIAGLTVSKLLSVALTYAAAPHRPRLSLRNWRYLAHFSFWSWAGSLALIVWARSDPFLLSKAIGTTLLGVYVVSCEIAILPVTELIEPVGGALFSGFAMAHRTGQAPSTAGFGVATALALCAVPFSIGISACSGYLVAALLGPGWMAAQPLIAVLAWLCMFSPFSYVCGSVLSAHGHVRRVFFCNATAAACKIAMLVAVLQFTNNLALIAGVNVAIVAVEATLFIGQLRLTGNRGLRELGWTMLRASFAAVAICALLSQVPGTWQPCEASRASALLYGFLIGSATFALFALLHAMLWLMAGRPTGPERIINDLLKRTARSCLSLA